jgi:hypothetical protein
LKVIKFLYLCRTFQKALMLTLFGKHIRPGAEIGRQAWLRAMCPQGVRVRVPLRARQKRFNGNVKALFFEVEVEVGNQDIKILAEIDQFVLPGTN